MIVNFRSTLTPSPWLLKTMTVTEKLLLFFSENYINTNICKLEVTLSCRYFPK